ncbi:MAG: polyribonucleotide nucleotidyltransferase [Bacteroidota bacterium]
MQPKTVSIDFAGKEYSLETGRFAKFASGAVMVRCGESMVLVTAVASQEERKEIDFLPLQVEYREKIASAGKIPGGFFKREGRPSNHEVLASRLIDRPIRPMLPKSWRFETQILATVYSSDPEVNPDTLASVGASAALMISDIPFAGPMSEVRVGRVNGEFVINPSHEMLEESDIDMTVGGTETAIVMVEGESREISEDDFLGALDFAHEHIKQLNKLQKMLAEEITPAKREFVENKAPEELRDFIKDLIMDDLMEYVHTITSKSERSEWRGRISEKAQTAAEEKYSENEEFEYLDNPNRLKMHVKEVLGDLEKKEMRKMILSESKRLDGRKLDEIRPVSCEVGLLPRSHGSALFTRGETQSLSTTTLGTKQDEQMIDGLLPTFTEHFMLHYNFPPFCTGETGRLMLGRREIGHGHLAWRALKNILPNQDEFPYTIRVVSDILESNGSSSMATVCAGSLCMFDAGVPMEKSVAGIAMGLIKEDDDVAILSDILGDEDFLGDMDFKLAGTRDGITAYQMDIKIEGLPIEIMKKALSQAKAGRDHLLGVMDAAISEPRSDISKYAPRFTVIMIPQDMIGTVIGPGGETIRGLCAETDTEINIEDDGKVIISSNDRDKAEMARTKIEALVAKPEEGKVYEGRVADIREGLGAFVEFMPKRQGLLHISEVAHEHIRNVSDVLSVGDIIEVKLLEVTRDGKYRLSRRALLPTPEGYVEERRERPPRRDDRRGGPSGRDRGGRGGRRPDRNR